MSGAISRLRAPGDPLVYLSKQNSSDKKKAKVIGPTRLGQQ